MPRKSDPLPPTEMDGALIEIDESSNRARISRYELGVHEPAAATARLIADALGVSLVTSRIPGGPLGGPLEKTAAQNGKTA